MRKARSAGVYATLGATLIAITFPITGMAENSAGSVSGISGGDIKGISGGDSQGISGGDTLGISGGDIQGISGGDALGISGGDIQGISGGDALGISGGDALGISGGDSQGISGGDALGISGGDSQGISGGDALGISGGDSQGISGGDALGISGGDSQGISGGDALGISGGDILAGPVDRIDTVNGVFESLGQVVMASQGMLSGLRVGDFVSVQGSVVGAGWLYADRVSVSKTSYVAGATEILVTGMLSSVDLTTGTASIGNLTIDYTPSLGSGTAPQGAMWSFRGIRPVKDGAMLSDRGADIR